MAPVLESKQPADGAAVQVDADMLRRLSSRLGRGLADNPRTPKYRCLRDVLIELMASGDLPEGTRLPTEQAMAEALPVSLGTVQKALRDLVASGELVRQRRHGTFVAAGDHRREISKPAFNFLRPDGDRVKMVFIRLRARRLVQRDGPWTEVLGHCPEGYVYLEREDQIDGVINACSEIYLRADLAGELMQLPADQFEHESVIPLLQALRPLGDVRAENRLSLCRIPRRLRSLMGADAPESESPARGLRLDVRYHHPEHDVIAWMVMTMPLHDYTIVTVSDGAHNTL